MIIENIEKEFLETKVDRMDISTGLSYKTIIKAYIGIENQDSFDLFLFNLHRELNNKNNVLFIENLLKITTDFDLIEKAKSDYSIVEKSDFKNSRINLVHDIELNNIILNNLDKLFKMLDNEIKHTKMNFATKFILWIREYLKDIKLHAQEIPKVIYYGNIKKHESYFLMFLNMCGFDVLYLNPCGLSNVKTMTQHTNKLEIFENTIVNDSIPFKQRLSNGEELDKTKINKITTLTATVQKKVQKELFEDTGMVIGEWQLEDKQLKTAILHTTFEEISIYYNQALSFRPHFESKNDIIVAPLFFSKIIGVHDEDSNYYEFVNKLKKDNNTLFLEFLGNENILRTKDFNKNDFKLTYLINSNNEIERKGTINENEFELSILDTKLQNKILDALEEVFKSKFFTHELTTTDKVKMLHFVLNLNRNVLLALENFDYGAINPKLVLYINERLSMSTEFAGILLLLHKLGFDVLLLTPVGSKDIEKILDETIIDTHKLSKIVETFNLNEFEHLKSNSKNFLNKLFKKLKI